MNAISSRLQSFFINGHQRTLLAKKNIAISLVLKGITIAIGLILVPLTINYVNTAQYGIWLTLSSIIGWFNFFDIGLANGLKNKIAEANALNQTGNIRAYISTTYALLIAISLTIFVLFYITNFLLNWSRLLNAGDVNLINLNDIALLVFASFCIQFVLQTLSSVLTAFHAVAKISVIYTIGQVGCLILIFLLTKHTAGSLYYLVFALAGFPLLVQFCATIWYFKKVYVEYSPSYKVVNLKFAKSLLSVGGAFFFVQIGSLLLFQTDNIVVTQLFGPQQVTIYNISYRLFSVVSMGFTIVMNPFWPAFTDAYAKNDIAWIEGVFAKMYKYFGLLCGISFIILLASPFIFKIWLGDKVTVPFKLSFCMTLYVIGVCWMTIHCFLVNGIGKIRLQLYLYIVSTIINIPLAIVFGKCWGVTGVAVSNLLILLMMGVVLYIQCKKILNRTAIGVWND